MPERIFKYKTVPELIALAKSLADTVSTGNVKALRNSSTGWLAEYADLSLAQIRTTLMSVRFEIYTRGQGNANLGIDPDEQCLALEPTSPLREKVTRVETWHQDSY